MPLISIGLTLLSALGFAIGNVLDKVIMTNYVARPPVKVFWYGLFAPIVALPAFWLGSVTVPLPALLLVILLAGALFFSSLVLVMRAMQLSEVSRLALLKQTSPLFVLGFSVLALHEVLAPVQYAGVALLLAAGLLAALDTSAEGRPALALNRPFWLVMTASVLNGGAVVLLKYALQFTNVWTVFFWEQLGVFLLAPGVLVFGHDLRVAVRASLRQPTTLALLAASTAVFVGAVLSYTAAMIQASATLVAAMNTINPLFTLLLVMGLQLLGARSFEERLTRTSIATKTLACVLFATGVYLVR